MPAYVFRPGHNPWHSHGRLAMLHPFLYKIDVYIHIWDSVVGQNWVACCLGVLNPEAAH